MTEPIRPQEGPQEAFLASASDIALYGGAAGGGKTWALLLEPLRHIEVKGFGAVFFRRNTTQIRNEGGLWDESENLYPLIQGNPKSHNLQWDFPAGTSVTMAHLEYDKTVLNYQGSQIPLICFDELTHFTEKQFWYMLSRNRSMCGVRPYIRATCNPDADSWVALFVAWWIDQETGFAIPERSGIVRWFVRIGNTIKWADSPEGLSEYKMTNDDGVDVPIPPKSFTFIAAKLTDNKALMAADPGYMANLLALSRVDRERLLGGNWKIRPSAGLYFKREWVEIIDTAPAGLREVRGWDLAATPENGENDPDWTTGTKMGLSSDGTYYILDHVYDRLSPNGVERLIRNTASQDGVPVQIRIPQDPGQAGKSQVLAMTKMLAGYDVRSATMTGDKVTRFSPFSAQAEAGNVKVVRGAWNDRWLSELENFPPETGHDDDADSTSEAFSGLSVKLASGATKPLRGLY